MVLGLQQDIVDAGHHKDCRLVGEAVLVRMDSEASRGDTDF
jgi:hypothetical protein